MNNGGGWQLAWDRGTSNSCSCFDENMVSTWYVCLDLNKLVPPLAGRNSWVPERSVPATPRARGQGPLTQGLSKKPLSPLKLAS